MPGLQHLMWNTHVILLYSQNQETKKAFHHQNNVLLQSTGKGLYVLQSDPDVKKNVVKL